MQWTICGLLCVVDHILLIMIRFDYYMNAVGVNLGELWSLGIGTIYPI